MLKQLFNKSYLLLLLLIPLTIFVVIIKSSEREAIAQTGETSGALVVLDPNGKTKRQCPLKHTDVKAEISGFLSRVNVTQSF